MTDPNLLRELKIDDADVTKAFEEAFGKVPDDQTLSQIVDGTLETFQPNTILTGRVVRIEGDNAVIDVGLKSEGVVPLTEWSDPSGVDVGDEVEVWLEPQQESDGGIIKLSKSRADRARAWERILTAAREGDVVRGRVTRKIKGGLLVDIGVPVFLPASQVDIRRTGDAGEYLGREIEAKILKIDPERRNIVISRRKMLEEQRETAKQALLAEIAIGQRRKGIVKNIADFGVFVDLGGIDGLLHITDMSWDRINHPSEMVRPEQEIEIVVLNVDKEKEKIALGLKQKSEDPWTRIEEKYPVGSRVKGEVVNVVNYGIFVKLEPGVEGLVHISEMSWTRRVNHPSEMVKVGDTIDVVVLDVNRDKKEISLGMKQAEENPWTRVAEKYPPNTIVEGTVRNLTNYGAFIEIEEGIDGLLHVTDMSWTKKVSHPSELLKKGDQVRCVVLAVDEDKQRIALGLKQLTEDPWLRAIPERYIPGQIVQGKVTKITNFGVFVELEPGLEGLLHISELADEKVDDPHNIVKVGEDLEVKILRVDPAERKIGLSKKRAEWASDEQGGAAQEPERRRELRGGLEGPGASTGRSGQLIDEAGFIRNANRAREQKEPQNEQGQS
jgi:small subunit ribosomal protein S1